MCLAKRVQLLQEAYLHYRQDNENSSVNSPKKVFCVCDEYEEMHKFLETNPLHRGVLEGVCNRIKYDTYMWNLDRLSPRFKYIFLERAGQEFKECFEKGTMDSRYFEEYKWEAVKEWAEDPIGFYNEYALNKPGYSMKELKKIKKSYSYRIGRLITFLPRKILGGIQSIKDDGVVYTFQLGCKKIIGGISCLKGRKSQ